MVRLLLILLILCCVDSLYAQEPHTQSIKKTEFDYKDFVVVGNKMVAINDSSDLVVWNLNDYSITSIDSQSNYTALFKRNNGDVYVGTQDGSVFIVNPLTSERKLVISCPYTILAISVNSKEEVFLVVYYVVYSPTRKKHWKRFTNHTKMIITTSTKFGIKRKPKRFFRVPSLCYLDKTGRWWMMRSYGEFGGDVQIFDVEHAKVYNKHFHNLNPDGLNPNSIFEDTSGNVYISSGLQHFMNFGDIYKIDKERNASILFNGTEAIDSTSKNMFGDYDTYYVGPSVYDTKTNSIYMTTSTGVYKLPFITEDSVAKPKLLFKLHISSENESLSIGKKNGR